MKTQYTKIRSFALLLLMLISAMQLSAASKQMEYLNRGVVAVKVNNGVYVSWRYLGTDDPSIGFNIYRDGAKVNDQPITTKTNYIDTKGTTNSKYVIKSVINGKETEASEAVTPWGQQYKTLKLKRPGTNYDGNDMSVGDVDGDGEYELFMKWYPKNAKDNSQDGKTDNCIIDCYKLDGTFLWRIDLGVNIRSGAHYTQYQVYDYDGDGKCEMVCKTAPGTKDGKGKYVILGNDDPKKDYRNGSGYVLSGPEYLTIFDGQTGAEIHTIKYKPERGNVGGWGDSYGNRVDRFLACTAYLDGVHPSVVMCRGYYTRSTLAAYDFKNGKLVERWFHDSPNKGQGAYGEGFHNVSVADVDGDGKDEIIYGSACIDDNGKLIYRKGFAHGDAMHVSDMDPDNAGLEGWFVHESGSAAYGYELRDLKTGKVLWGKKTGTDNGRGLAADIDAKHKGFECWSSAPGVFDCKGKQISSNKPSVNFRVYWDGDLQDELLDGNKIDKWNGNGTSRMITLKGNACNGSKNTPCLSADILGDWREEVILHEGENIYIYTTTIETKYRLFTLMHDAVYRCGIAWQNTAYNQPPHLGFYIGDGVDKIKQPDIYTPGHSAPVVAPTQATLETSGALSQELFAGEELAPISFSFGGAATDLEVESLPNGLTAKKDGSTTTISGTMTESGSFTVKTKGGENTISKTVNITIVPSGKKNIAYICDPSNDNFKNDKILSMLKDDKNFYVRTFESSNNGYDYSKFDLVVISETTPSTAAIMNELKGIKKPILDMKVQGYKTAEGAWNWTKEGFGDNTDATNIVINDTQKNHAIFQGVEFTNGNEIQMFNEVNAKALTYMNPESFDYVTGEIKTIASIKGEEQVNIFEIEQGTSIAGSKIEEKFIQIGMNSSSFSNITDDGLKVVKNACLYLMNSLPSEKTYAEIINADIETSIYPNPVKETLNIRIVSDKEGSAVITLIGLDGSIIDHQQVTLHAGVNTLSKDMTQLPKRDSYILQIQCSHGTILVKTILFN